MKNKIKKLVKAFESNEFYYTEEQRSVIQALKDKGIKNISELFEY